MESLGTKVHGNLRTLPGTPSAARAGLRTRNHPLRPSRPDRRAHLPQYEDAHLPTPGVPTLPTGFSDLALGVGRHLQTYPPGRRTQPPGATDNHGHWIEFLIRMRPIHTNAMTGLQHRITFRFDTSDLRESNAPVALRWRCLERHETAACMAAAPRNVSRQDCRRRRAGAYPGVVFVIDHAALAAGGRPRPGAAGPVSFRRAHASRHNRSTRRSKVGKRASPCMR